MDEKEILRKKYQLVASKEWEEIKSFMYENIKILSGSDIDPKILQGMLKNIYDTDKWKTQYLQKIEEK